MLSASVSGALTGWPPILALGEFVKELLDDGELNVSSPPVNIG